MKVSISKLMSESGVNFGTSGVRGLVADMTDEVCFSYVCAFLQHMKQQGYLADDISVGIAGDLRSSTDRIMNACAAACRAMSCEPVNLGRIPSPAVALYGIQHAMPTIMVTGSHIPDDRNGIKFNTPRGEILKQDEQAIKVAEVMTDSSLFENGSLSERYLPEPTDIARQHYIARFLNLFSADALHGKRIGIYQHSSVARDVLPEIFQGLGAEVICLGRSEQFVSVDTEAIRSEDVVLAKQWAAEQQLDAIVSTDGDADRPLVSDEQGRWLRGDIAGILTAQFVGADYVVTPVSSNTALEKSQLFANTERTRIGSPFVIAAMMARAETSDDCVVGYEANGGFLQQSVATINQRLLAALPTRDAVIVMLAVLLQSQQAGKHVSELVATLPARYTASDRIKNIATEKSRVWLDQLTKLVSEQRDAEFKQVFPELEAVKAFNDTDGLRLTLVNDDIVHFRPSGNAPELRCYTESSSVEQAEALNQYCMQRLQALIL